MPQFITNTEPNHLWNRHYWDRNADPSRFGGKQGLINRALYEEGIDTSDPMFGDLSARFDVGKSRENWTGWFGPTSGQIVDALKLEVQRKKGQRADATRQAQDAADVGKIVDKLRLDIYGRQNENAKRENIWEPRGANVLAARGQAYRQALQDKQGWVAKLAEKGFGRSSGIYGGMSDNANLQYVNKVAGLEDWFSKNYSAFDKAKKETAADLDLAWEKAGDQTYARNLMAAASSRMSGLDKFNVTGAADIQDVQGKSQGAMLNLLPI